MYITEYEMAFRLFIACVFGGVVGFEREKNDSPAGFRTHILVSLGSALVMILSMYGFNDFATVNKDPARLAAQVVSGIGFLGAGTILRDKTSVKGLTTAASLWVVAAIGLAAGAGFYFSSFFVTLLVFLTLERSVETYFFRNSQTIRVEAINGTCKVKDINRLLESHSIVPQNISMTLLKEDHNRTTIEYKVRTPFRKIDMEQIIEDINEIDGIFSAEQVGNTDSSLLVSMTNVFTRFKRPNKPSL
ncbi:MgtC/SapB family protein [Desulfosporosinus meridiei]|uniref:Putative membrane protein n=1 Tax=Desulfosporosinus meridiei (strain ATCC BAA-275 / DSM 13257 / KCTC 12902 / NCIMB 13706 / S10) TaxID=768704 RepID=J7J1E4_DESMD|nr:MgtC/SapB family protein [Desulfosporosinus meridiei]AFQ46184.1 putative membrane protein [Desulfosporosinus meridiei DSM 13257]